MDPGWLRQFGAEGLAGVLARRPEVTTPAPASLAELASRLTDSTSVRAALRRLVLPSLQVAEAIAALDSATDRADLDRLLGAIDPEAIAAVDRALLDLMEHGLLTTDGDTLKLVPGGRLAWRRPLGLGDHADVFLSQLPARELRMICDALGVPAPARKAEVVAAIAAAIRDGDHIRSMVAAAPPKVQQVLAQIARRGGVILLEHAYGVERSPLRWATDRGLLFSTGPWSDELVMPAEAALSLRGPDYTAPFQPRRPSSPRAPVDPVTVARDAAAAAGNFLRLAARVLDDAGRTRIAMIRSGGVGIREIRRLAKACDADVNGVRLVLGVLHGAGLLSTFADGVTPTERYDAWLAREPADQHATLVRAWWSLPYSPLATDGGWVPSEVDNGTPDLRAAALGLLATEPGAPADDLSFVELVHWRHPFLLRAGLDTYTAAVVAWRLEATTLGVLGAGAMSDAGRALLAGDDDALAAALESLGRSATTAHLQADLTAVVAGNPCAGLADLLCAVADRESAGAATTWRFSPDSIRRAMDSGWTGDRLLASLAEIAAGGVPQPLTYLVRDAERRHGVIRASAVVCCLRSDDTALLAEVAVDRRLRALDLRLLAPTVLAGSKPLAETLAALRKAGYAPVEELPDGSAVLETAPRRRTATARLPRSLREADALAPARRRAAIEATSGADALALAQALLARPDGEFRAPATPAPREDIDSFIIDGNHDRPVRRRDYPPYHPAFRRQYRRYY